MAAADGSLLKSLAEAPDFYAVSECRDMLFHAQEHRITLPEIKHFLAANSVEFAGFVLDAPGPAALCRALSERGALLDLDCWHALRNRSARTRSAGMYQFWLRKPAARAGAAATGVS